jgi:hypothetical protein
MELSVEDKAILAHVIVNPDAWVDHALNHGGEAAVRSKIDRWRNEYLAHKDDIPYMNRAQRKAKTPDEIAMEAAARAKIDAKLSAIADNLPSWTQVSTTVDNIGNLADAKAYLKKLSRVVYWLARNQAE